MRASMVIVVVVIALLVLWLVPLGVIWSLNLLFGLSIPYTLQTWFAAFLLSGVVGGSRSTSKG